MTFNPQISDSGHAGVMPASAWNAFDTYGAAANSVGGANPTEVGYLIGLESSLQTQLDTINASLAALASATIYKGGWNASTNTPTLASGVGTAGWEYRVKVAGNTNLDGETGWQEGDQATFNGVAWERFSPPDYLAGTGITLTGFTFSQTPLTASKAVVSDGSGNYAASTTTAAEIGFVAGVTSAIQTQLNSITSTLGGLGTAATHAATDFDASGAAATAQAAAIAASDTAGAAAAVLASSLQKSANLSDLANASTARTNLGLGTAATQASSAFDAAGAASTAQSNAIAACDASGASAAAQSAAQSFATSAANAVAAASVPTGRTITTTAPMTGGGDLSANRTLSVPVFVASGGSHASGLVPDPGASAASTHFLREDATWAIPPSAVNVDANGHYVPGATGTPTIAMGTGAGTIGTPTGSIVGLDESMLVTINTATSPLGGGTVATISFGKTWTIAPRSITLTPANLAALLLSGLTNVFVDPASISTTQFTITAATTGLAGAATYKFHCQAK